MMQTMLRRMMAVVMMAVLAGIGLAVTATWSPTTAGLVSPASAQEDDDDNDDDDDDGNGGRAPVGGVATGLGGTAESWTAEPVGKDRSTGEAISLWAAPLAALAVAGVMVGRLAFARLGGRND